MLECAPFPFQTTRAEAIESDKGGVSVQSIKEITARQSSLSQESFVPFQGSCTFVHHSRNRQCFFTFQNDVVDLLRTDRAL